jgi:hypothetical protein
MKFTKVFFRYNTTPGTVPQGAPNPILGSSPADSAPSPLAGGSVVPTYPAVLPAATQDNVLSFKSNTSQGGFPQKIAVLYGYVGAGSQPALTATMYFLEEGSGLWYLVGTAGTTLVKNGPTFFDAFSVPDAVPYPGFPGQQPGTIQAVSQVSEGRYMLVVSGSGAVSGQYYFAMAPILTSNP